MNYQSINKLLLTSLWKNPKISRLREWATHIDGECRRGLCLCGYMETSFILSLKTTKFLEAGFNFCADACWFVLTELSCSVFQCHILILTVKCQCKWKPKWILKCLKLIWLNILVFSTSFTMAFYETFGKLYPCELQVSEFGLTRIKHTSKSPAPTAWYVQPLIAAIL